MTIIYETPTHKAETAGTVGIYVNTRLSRLEFRNRLTGPEKEAIYTAADTSVAIRIWLDDLAAAEYIDLADPATIAAVNGLESLTLIGVGRADEILTP